MALTVSGREHERGHSVRESCQAESGRSERARSSDGSRSRLVEAPCRRGGRAFDLYPVPGDAAVCAGRRQLAASVDGGRHGRAFHPRRRRCVGFGGGGCDRDGHRRAPALGPGRAHELPQRGDGQEFTPLPPLPRARAVRQSFRPGAGDHRGRQGAADVRRPPCDQGVERRPPRQLLGFRRHRRERLSDRDRALPARRRRGRPGDDLGGAGAFHHRRLRGRGGRPRRLGPRPPG